MRRAIFWFGWAIVGLLPIAFVVEVVWQQDLPQIQPWKWAVLAGGVLLIAFARNRDDVLRHRVA